MLSSRQPKRDLLETSASRQLSTFRLLQGVPVWNNECEYLDSHTSPYRTINTAQSIMNWFAFGESPTWYWLHALKPTTNEESPGYGLGFWRPYNDTNFSHFPDLPAGHWTYNDDNWNGTTWFHMFRSLRVLIPFSQRHRSCWFCKVPSVGFCASECNRGCAASRQSNPGVPF